MSPHWCATLLLPYSLNAKLVPYNIVPFCSLAGEIEMLRVLPINDCMPLIPIPHGWHSPIDRADEFDLHDVQAFDQNESDHRKEMKSEEAEEGKMGWY